MAEGVSRSDLKQYFADARSWDEDRARAAIKSKRFAYIIASVGAATGIAGLGTVAMLVPLKRVELVTVRVNQTTGAVDVETELTGKKPIAYDEAVTKYFLANYVRIRESWNPASAQEDFNAVAILSTTPEQQRYNDLSIASNPRSPRALLGENGYANARVTNISFINNRVATVRFTRTIQTQTEATSTDWIATVTFSYTNAPMSEGDRYRNPLGFQVENFRADPVVAGQ
ncbi:virB8 family protein [Sphingomonas prati]|uniref:Type IV secretion system protein VirB8 n=1 Tax=Sphingomonas prati TaxID=1843237 RepID=A0A7W9BW01_9SPHN|nr:VirB8/TrbF family protein [Sphingomonas prati]MBB5730899.1 type IV secretion system protein VirB8 [Sphingomonas prati]GGE97651.1 conjugal transfer protein TraJ [Sphingomonas prati]